MRWAVGPVIPAPIKVIAVTGRPELPFGRFSGALLIAIEGGDGPLRVTVAGGAESGFAESGPMFVNSVLIGHLQTPPAMNSRIKRIARIRITRALHADRH